MQISNGGSKRGFGREITGLKQVWHLYILNCGQMFEVFVAGGFAMINVVVPQEFLDMKDVFFSFIFLICFI